MEFTLSLIELESEEIVWKAKLRECEYFLCLTELQFVSVENLCKFGSNSVSVEVTRSGAESAKTLGKGSCDSCGQDRGREYWKT